MLLEVVCVVEADLKRSLVLGRKTRAVDIPNDFFDHCQLDLYLPDISEEVCHHSCGLGLI